VTLILYNYFMNMKYEVMKLKDSISQNIEYLSTEYHLTNDILSELQRMENFDLSHSMMFQWWVENENSINTINKLLEELENI